MLYKDILSSYLVNDVTWNEQFLDEFQNLSIVDLQLTSQFSSGSESCQYDRINCGQVWAKTHTHLCDTKSSDSYQVTVHKNTN